MADELGGQPEVGALEGVAETLSSHSFGIWNFDFFWSLEFGVWSFHIMPTDWEARYQTGDMPWEKGEASPGLVDFLAGHPDLDRGTVAVPGCGTGHDVRAWAKA